MKKLVVMFILIFSVAVLGQQQPQQLTKEQQIIVEKAKPLQDQLKTLKANVYDYRKAIDETEKQIADVTNQIVALQKEFEEASKSQTKEEPKK